MKKSTASKTSKSPHKDASFPSSKQVLRASLLFGGLLLVGSANAATAYIGDAYADGQSITSPDEAHVYQVSELTVIMPGVSGINYTNNTGFDQQIKLTEVNFRSVFAGDVTPFVALWDGVSSSSAASGYTFLSIGDTLSVAADTLENGNFLVSGENPTITLSDGQTMVAGYHQIGGKVVNVIEAIQDGTEYIYAGNSISSVGNNPTSNASYSINSKIIYNIGYTVVPEPSAYALLAGLTGAAFVMVRRRRV